MHGHGGGLLEGLKGHALQLDIGPQDRFLWYSTTGWIMWNSQVTGLLVGATICIYDGNPGGSKDKPDWSMLWRFAAQTKVTFFGAGAAFYANCMKAGVELASCDDLSAVRALGTTGSPLSPEVQNWGTHQFEKIGTHDIWWCNLSGGTDFAGDAYDASSSDPATATPHPDPNPLDCNSHGSHVAGTAAGFGVTSAGATFSGGTIDFADAAFSGGRAALAADIAANPPAGLLLPSA